MTHELPFTDPAAEEQRKIREQEFEEMERRIRGFFENLIRKSEAHRGHRQMERIAREVDFAI